MCVCACTFFRSRELFQCLNQSMVPPEQEEEEVEEEVEEMGRERGRGRRGVGGRGWEEGKGEERKIFYIASWVFL